MAYDAAINKAWDDVCALKPSQNLSVKFLADEYSVDCAGKIVLSLSCNVPAKDFVAILLLHYLTKKLAGLPPLSGEWLDFKELAGIEGYASAFRLRSIEPVLRKYGKEPEGVLTVLERLPARKVNEGDVGIVVEAFEGVPVLVTLWRGDDEFGPEANMLFDRSITKIFCTEDIVVLAQLVAHQL
jgi:hypothetical protein